MRLRRQACGGAGETDDPAEFRLRQIRRFFAASDKLAHCASAEYITRTGRINNMDTGRALHCHTACAVRRIASFRPQRGVHQGYMVFLQQFFRAPFRGKAPEPFDLFIADLDDIRLMQAPLDLFPGIFLPFPQGFAQIGIQADQRTVAFSQFNGMAGGLRGRLICQGERTEVKDFRVRDERFVHFLRSQAGIGAGLPGKSCPR